MDFRGFQEYKPGASRYNGRISEDEWNKHKPKLRELHEAKLTRQQILDIISKDFGDIKPTYGQLCTKFDKWGFHVYRQNERKDTKSGGKKDQRKITKNDPAQTQQSQQSQAEAPVQQAFSPESSNGSTIVPDVGVLDINDKSTPVNFGTPQSQHLVPDSSWSQSTPQGNHSRNVSDHTSTPPLGTISEPDSNQQYQQYADYGHNFYPNGGSAQQWLSASSFSNTTTSHGGHRSSVSDTASSRTSLYHTMSGRLNNVELEDPSVIAARTRKADGALDAVSTYLRSVGKKEANGDHILLMCSLAAYLFATRSYSPAFRIYHKIYDIMLQDMSADEISRIGALMRCYQSAIDLADLQYMQSELHSVLKWNFTESSLPATVANMLQTIETQISEGFSLAQGPILSTTSVTRNLEQLMTKGSSSTYPGTKRLYWRLRLLTHSPFHSGCKRLLRLMSELLSWAWAAMAVLKFPDPALPNSGCLCNDGLYFDFVRMVTTVVLEAAVGFEIAQLIRINLVKAQTTCECVMCTDLETTFEICPIETFTAIAFLTVDRCRLDWTSCHPGGRHQELTPNTILKEQLLPTVESLLDQVAADIRSQTTIHTSDLYDDFLSCIWSTFETHDLPLKNARFDASTEKVEDLMTTLITEELNKSHPARNSSLDGHMNGERDEPVFTYGENCNDDLANRITAKRTRSNASALTKSSSNASERSMIRIRKKLKFRTNADYLNSMSSYSSLSSRNSMNRFSYVTGLPELETTLEDDEFGSDPRDLPPDLTPDEFRTMQRHDSWSRRSYADGQFSWAPSRAGSTVSRSMSWRESRAGDSGSRPGSTVQTGGGSLNRHTSLREAAMQNNQRDSLNQQREQQGQVTYQDMGTMQGSANQRSPQNVPQQHQYQYQHQQEPPQPQYRYESQNVPSSQSQTQRPVQPKSIQNRYHVTNQQQHHANMQASASLIHPQLADCMGPPGPVNRRDSTKTTRSKESQKGRWSTEAERVERILRAAQ